MAALADLIEKGAEFLGFFGEVDDDVFSLAEIFVEIKEIDAVNNDTI